jgi:hypothetical protein
MAIVKTHRKSPAPGKLIENQERSLSVEEEYALNCRVADRILREAKQGMGQWRMGQYIALLRGEVIKIGESLEEVSDALRDIEPDRDRGLLCEIRDPDEVLRK